MCIIINDLFSACSSVHVAINVYKLYVFWHLYSLFSATKVVSSEIWSIFGVSALFYPFSGLCQLVNFWRMCIIHATSSLRFIYLRYFLHYARYANVTGFILTAFRCILWQFRPSLRHTPVLCQNEGTQRMRSSPSGSPVSLVFSRQEWLMGDDHV